MVATRAPLPEGASTRRDFRSTTAETSMVATRAPLPEGASTCRDFRSTTAEDGSLNPQLCAGFGDEVRVATAGSETGEALLDISTEHPLADRVADG